jgi:hypothetical protein
MTSKAVVYTVNHNYLVANGREDWQRLEALLSQRLSELCDTFIPVCVQLIKDQRGYDVCYFGGDAVVNIEDSQYEEAWDWAWDAVIDLPASPVLQADHLLGRYPPELRQRMMDHCSLHMISGDELVRRALVAYLGAFDGLI